MSEYEYGRFDISRYPQAYSWQPPDPKTDPERYEPHRKPAKKRDQRTPSLAPTPALDRIKEKYGDFNVDSAHRP